MLILRLGWRNCWRRPRRSLITISAIATALVFLILLLGMSEGMKVQMLRNGTGLLMSHLQLHHPDYLPDRSLYDTLGGPQGVDSRLNQMLEAVPQVEATSPRVYGFALLSTGEYSAGAQVLGVRPQSESRVTTLLQGLVQGQALEETPSRQLLLGDGLAKELRAGVGSEVAAVTQAADGSLGNALFTVTGVLRTGLAHLDRSLAVTHLEDLQDLLALEVNRYHEVAIRLSDPSLADAVAEQLNESGNLPAQVLAQSWGDLSPQLRDYLQLFDSFYGILIGFVAIFAALGVLNTMMMAVFERTREMGVVSSLGMSPVLIVSSILLETVFLASLGLLSGLLLGAVFMQPLTTGGLDLSRWMGELSVMNTRMDPVIQFVWLWKHVAWSAIGLTLATLLAAAFPAVRAARMNPVEALNAPVEVN